MNLSWYNSRGISLEVSDISYVKGMMMEDLIVGIPENEYDDDANTRNIWQNVGTTCRAEVYGCIFRLQCEEPGGRK